MRYHTLATVRAASMMLLFLAAFVTWIGYGLADNWRQGAIYGAYLALIRLGIMALTHVVGGSLFSNNAPDMRQPGIIALCNMAAVPLCALTWAHYSGWAWLWVYGWIHTGTLLYRACWQQLLRRRAINNGLAIAISLLDREAPVKQQQHFVLWTAAISSLNYLAMANTGVAKPLVVAMGVVALLALSVFGWLESRIIKNEKRRRNPHLLAR